MVSLHLPDLSFKVPKSLLVSLHQYFFNTLQVLVEKLEAASPGPEPRKREHSATEHFPQGMLKKLLSLLRESKVTQREQMLDHRS